MRVHRVIRTQISPMLKDAETFGNFAGGANKRVDVGVGWKDRSSSDKSSSSCLLVHH